MGKITMLAIAVIVILGLRYVYFANPEMFWTDIIRVQNIAKNIYNVANDVSEWWVQNHDDDQPSSQSTQHTTGSGGIIADVSLAIYADATLSNPIDFIDWGAAHINQTIYQTVYVVNTGTVPLTLGFWTSNYHPTNAQQIVFGVDGYNGGPLPPNGVQQLQLKMKLPAYANFTAFTFDVNIQGQEVN